MEKYVCSICGYIYDEAEGIPGDGIEPGTRWEDVAQEWVCILCSADKSQFEKESKPATTRPKKSVSLVDTPVSTKDMSAQELSILCTNLAQGCTKQYKTEEADLFNELADYFKASSTPAKDPAFEQLAKLVEEDFNTRFEDAKTAANDVGDRGALRSLVWSDKVTRILKSLLSRYEKQGEAVIEDKDVSVCTICGFIFVGNKLPELCPVCKVPNWKFEKIEGR